MRNIKVLILRTAGTNCDLETRVAFELLDAKVSSLHVNEFVKGRKKIYDYQIVVFPGGFTYGDDIAAGKVLANELKMKLKDQVGRLVAGQGLMIGICNGFQVLVKLGVLPGNNGWEQEVTLGCNDSGKFEDRWVYLKKPERESRCVWTKGCAELIYIPVAHGEGKFICRDASVRDKIRDNGQIVFQYSDADGLSAPYPANPNGSISDIAGICDESGQIFGLMPHPERCVFRTQHPRWTRGEHNRVPDGLKIFKSGMDFLKK